MAEPPGGNGAVSPPAGLPREVREQLAELELELSEGERRLPVGPPEPLLPLIKGGGQLASWHCSGPWTRVSAL